MESKKIYIVCFGNSQKYSVAYAGSKEEFEKSAEFRHIRDSVFDYIDKKFPTGGYCDRIAIEVREPEGKDDVFPELNAESLEELKQNVAREVEVYRDESNSHGQYYA